MATKNEKKELTPIQQKVIDYLKSATEPSTLEAIGKAIGVVPLRSGTINALVKRGLIANVGKVEKEVIRKEKVSVYAISAAKEGE